MEVQCIS